MRALIIIIILIFVFAWFWGNKNGRTTDFLDTSLSPINSLIDYAIEKIPNIGEFFDKEG